MIAATIFLGCMVLLCIQFHGSLATESQDTDFKLSEGSEKGFKRQKRFLSSFSYRHGPPSRIHGQRLRDDTYFFRQMLRQVKKVKKVVPNYDEVAMSICGFSPSGLRTFAVPRDCNSNITCKTICEQALSGFQDMLYSFFGNRKGKRSDCFKALHIYGPHNMNGPLPRPTPNGKPVAIVSPASCRTSLCGPNYCCCEVYDYI